MFCVWTCQHGPNCGWFRLDLRWCRVWVAIYVCCSQLPCPGQQIQWVSHRLQKPAEAQRGPVRQHPASNQRRRAEPYGSREHRATGWKSSDFCQLPVPLASGPPYGQNSFGSGGLRGSRAEKKEKKGNQEALHFHDYHTLGGLEPWLCSVITKQVTYVPYHLLSASAREIFLGLPAEVKGPAPTVPSPSASCSHGWRSMSHGVAETRAPFLARRWLWQVSPMTCQELAQTSPLPKRRPLSRRLRALEPSPKTTAKAQSAAQQSCVGAGGTAHNHLSHRHTWQDTSFSLVKFEQ